MEPKTIIGLLTALGVGLLVGIERERARTDGSAQTAGVRTFALTALLGAIAALLDSPALTVCFAVLVGLHSAVGYFRTASTDPGMTTEIALLLSYLLGVYALNDPVVAAALGLTVTILLTARGWLHAFVRQRLSEQELHDALLLGAAALVVLPLLPDRTVDPWQVLNPRTIWKYAVLLMLVNGLGYVALRALGPSRGLPLSGLVSGFVSSSATHGAMGSLARSKPEAMSAAVAGAALSSVATVLQLALIVALLDAHLLRFMAAPLLAAFLCTVAYGAAFLRHALRGKQESSIGKGRAFNPRMAISFALLMGVVLMLTALAQHYFGVNGVYAGSAISGLADAHAAAASSANLNARGALPDAAARTAILLAFSTNAITKAVLAFSYGGPRFGFRLLPGLVLTVAAAWLAIGWS